jgi:hypothetical protein
MATCTDYVPGEKKGARMAVCTRYQDNGTCTLQNHFMCVFFLDAMEKRDRASKKDKKQRSRGGLGIKCKKTHKWVLREDCQYCEDKETEECGV